jgi:hypothetical protein
MGYLAGVLLIFSCFATALGLTSFYIELALLSFRDRIVGSCLILFLMSGDDPSIRLFDGPASFSPSLFGPCWGPGAVGLA